MNTTDGIVTQTLDPATHAHTKKNEFGGKKKCIPGMNMQKRNVVNKMTKRKRKQKKEEFHAKNVIKLFVHTIFI